MGKLLSDMWVSSVVVIQTKDAWHWPEEKRKVASWNVMNAIWYPISLLSVIDLKYRTYTSILNSATYPTRDDNVFEYDRLYGEVIDLAFIRI